MITIHHLGMSQSDRIVWLMEELGLPYELVWYDRGPDGLAPPEYRALHPAATAPVIADGDLVLTESAVIVEHICHRHAGGKLSVGPDAPNYTDYLYWMHFNNNLQGLFFSTLAMGEGTSDLGRAFVQKRADVFYGYMNDQLAARAYLAGDSFTCADIMVTFNVTTLPMVGDKSRDDYPHIQAYVERVMQRPAYQKAMSIAGPTATRPKAGG